MFRAMAARSNFLAQDRSDISYAAKELCRDMSKPNTQSWARLKRLGRYLVAHPRRVTEFNYQGRVSRITVHVDSDYAGCIRTRKSTSGGILTVGSHSIKHWSSTQTVIALSSGEAEYYAIVKGGANAIGVKGFMNDLGVKYEMIEVGAKQEFEIHTDSTAAKAMASRRGVGKVWHIDRVH